MIQRSKAINLFIRCCLEEPGQEAPDSSDTVSITWFRWELVKIDRPPHRLDSLGEEVVAGKGAFELSPLRVAFPAHQCCHHHCQLKWTSWSRTTYGSTASLPPGMAQCPWRALPAGTSGSPSRCCTRTLLENALGRCHHCPQWATSSSSSSWSEPESESAPCMVAPEKLNVVCKLFYTRQLGSQLNFKPPDWTLKMMMTMMWNFREKSNRD